MEMVVISMLRAPLRAEFGIDDMGFAMLGSVVFAGLLTGNVTGGLFADWYGRRICLISMGILFCVAGTLSAFAQTLWQFIFLRFLTGIGIGSMIPVTDAYVLEWSPTEWRSRLVMGLIGLPRPC
jgi:MFS family permease